MLHELHDMRERTAATSERAQSIVMDLRLLSAEEVAEHEAFRLQHEPATAQRYRQLRDREQQTLIDLESVADAGGTRSAALVDTLQAMSGRGHQLPDAYVAGQVGDAAFNGALPGILATRDSADSVLHALDSTLAARRASDVAQGGRVLARSRALSLTVGLLALLGIGVVVWFARRDRALSERLARALADEARAHADADRRREEVERVTESKGRLVRGFTHDVRNPIGAADGFMQLLEDGVVGLLTERQTESVRRARRALASALGLIEDLLELARAEADVLDVRREAVDLHALARETVEEHRPLAERKGLSLGIQSTADRVVAQGDPVRLRQVLGNLVSNAVKYTSRGRVTVRVAGPRSDADAPSRRASIEVVDTGAGIPAEQQALVFQEFVRLDPDSAPGSGVGLAISQRIAHTLGGEITMMSEAGRGSSFVLWLPVAGGADGGGEPLGHLDPPAAHAQPAIALGSIQNTSQWCPSRS
jgi:signal transduction histidine kinase